MSSQDLTPISSGSCLPRIQRVLCDMPMHAPFAEQEEEVIFEEIDLIAAFDDQFFIGGGMSGGGGGPGGRVPASGPVDPGFDPDIPGSGPPAPPGGRVPVGAPVDPGSDPDVPGGPPPPGDVPPGAVPDGGWDTDGPPSAGVPDVAQFSFRRDADPELEFTGIGTSADPLVLAVGATGDDDRADLVAWITAVYNEAGKPVPDFVDL